MFSLKYESRKIKIGLLVISCTFFLVNLYVIIRYGNRFLLGDMQKMNNDDVKYIRSAFTLITKGKFTYQNPNASSVFIMPGIVFTLAPFVKICGMYNVMTSFRIFQAILQTFSLLLLFFICRKAFGSKIGLIACILDAFYAPEIISTCKILTEVEFKFFLLLLIYVSLYAIESKKSVYYCFGGLFWSIACLYRPTIALFPIVMLAAWAINKYTLKEMIKFSLIASSVFIAVLSPWWIRNYIEFKQFIPLTNATGNPFLHGAYINYKGYNSTALGDKAELKLGVKLFMKNFHRQPLEYLKWYTIGKSKFFWDKPYTSMTLKKSINDPFVRYHRLILFLGICGALIIIYKKDKNGIFIFLTIAYFNVIYLPYIALPRYAYPSMPLVIIISGYAVVKALSVINNARIKLLVKF